VKILTGHYDLTIDEKNRLLVPVEVRRSLDPETDGQSFYLVKGLNGSLWFWCQRVFEQQAQGRTMSLKPTLEELKEDHDLFGDADYVEMDRQGRVLIPERRMQQFAFPKNVLMVAARTHLELWDPPAYEIWRNPPDAAPAAA
jgi:MraZ protein